MSTTKNPYSPDMEACRMTIRTSEATCYVMDTHCRDISAEQKEKIDGDIAHIYRQAMLRKNVRED